MKKNLFDPALLLILIFTGFVSCLFAPFEMYIQNRKEFWFLFSTFYGIPVLVFLVAVITGYFIGILLPDRLSAVYKAVAFSFGLCMYIQGTFLNLDVGVMNGSEIDWSLFRGKMIVNLIIWGCVFLILIAVSVKAPLQSEKIMKYASAFISGMLFLTLVFLFVSHRDEIFVPNEEVEYLSDGYEYDMDSAEGDVLVFILDMFDTRYFQLLEDEQFEALDDFDGFIYFDNYAGKYSTTNSSMRYLFTGKLFRNEFSEKVWQDMYDDETLYLDELHDAGVDLYFYPNEIKDYIPRKNLVEAVNYRTGKQIITNRLHFTYDVYCLVMCRYFPDIIKPYIWMDGTEFEEWEGYGDGDRVATAKNLQFYSRLISDDHDGTDEGDNKEFKVIYLYGTHYPYEMDENVQPTEPSYEDPPISTAKGVIRILEYYIDKLKRDGTYDNTSIIVTADHGLYYGGDRSSPVFLVKPAHSFGAVTVNHAPVSHDDFPATVLYLEGDPNYRNFGESVFDVAEDAVRDRYFYQYYLDESGDDMGTDNFRMIEYKIDPYGNSHEHFHLTDVEYTVFGKPIKHSDYCSLCQSVADISELESEEWTAHTKADNYPKGDELR